MSDQEALEKQKNDLPRVNQTEFKRYLPGLVSKELTAEAAVLRKGWLNICIDPRLSVLVVDDKTGEVLHRVPPLTYTSNNLTGKNVAGTIDVWSKENDVSPYRGNAYAEEHLTPDLVLGTPPEEDVELWVEILKMYNIVESDSDVLEGVSQDAISDDPSSW